jgi:hypothetical protein
MRSTKNPGRFAGVLYVLTSIVGFFAMGYVPRNLIVDGNATATASNIATHETLFRLGIAGELIGQAGLYSWPWLCTICSRGSTGGRPRSW